MKAAARGDNRLAWLSRVAVLVVAARSWWAGWPRVIQSVHRTARTGEYPMVQVHVFNRQGELVGPVESPKLELSDAEWRKRLTREQFDVLRSKGTERPFCGTLLDNKLHGVYTCAGCGLPLFSSDSKFNSGTGWPS